MDHPVKPQPRSNDSEAGQNSEANTNTHTELVFNEVSIRLGFIRKVFGIFTAQAFLTMGILAVTNLNPNVRTLLRDNLYWFSAVPILIALVVFLVLLANEEMTRRFPLNFILLGIYTLSFGFGVGALATLSEQGHVLYAGGILLCACSTVTLYTLQTKFDLKWYGHGLIVLVSVAAASFICYAILPFSQESSVVIIPAVSGLVISIYLAVLVHVTMSGEFWTFRPENYVLVSLYAYLVLVSVFLLALVAMGADSCPDCQGDCGGCGNCCCGGFGEEGGHGRRENPQQPLDV